MRVIGLDIGGANLKASDGERQSLSHAFPLWKNPERLSDALQLLLTEFPRPQQLAVTMTGELADCFATKTDGVEQILRSVTEAVDVPVHVWQLSGEFVSPDDAIAFPHLTAAANWHALATWAGRMTPQGTALLIDMGSTTTDIIPLIDGLPANQGSTDLQRLAASELVYTGTRRTPVCAVTQSVHIESCEIPLAAEFFATMHDVALILGDTDEDATNCDTADGRPATIDHARSRLARMLCCDRTELTDEQLTQIAVQIRDAQQQQLADALNRVLNSLPTPPTSLLLSGEGERTIRRLLDRVAGAPNGALRSHTVSTGADVGQRRVGTAPGREAVTQLGATERPSHPIPTLSLHDSLGPTHSTAACAYALARLGTERIR